MCNARGTALLLDRTSGRERALEVGRGAKLFVGVAGFGLHFADFFAALFLLLLLRAVAVELVRHLPERFFLGEQAAVFVAVLNFYSTYREAKAHV